MYIDLDSPRDILEVNGDKDLFGNTRTSDTSIADIDGQGRLNDYETSVLFTDMSGHTFWKVRAFFGW